MRSIDLSSVAAVDKLALNKVALVFGSDNMSDIMMTNVQGVYSRIDVCGEKFFL